MMAEPPDLPCREDVLIEDSAAAPKSCLPSLEMRSPTADVGLLPIGEASTATKTTFNKSPLRFYSNEATNSKETHLWPSVPSSWYDSSFWRNKLLAAPPAGGLSRQTRCKIGRSIQAVSRLSPHLPGFGIVARVALW